MPCASLLVSLKFQASMLPSAKLFPLTYYVFVLFSARDTMTLISGKLGSVAKGTSK